MPDITVDPFSAILKATWAMLEDFTPWTILVPAGNRIKLFEGAPRQVFKQSRAEGDFPEVRIVNIGGVPHLQRTSSSSFFMERWEVQIFTGDQTYQKLFPIKWQTYRALATWATQLRALTYQGNIFVHLAKPTEVDARLTVTEDGGGIIGWSALWSGETHMDFLTPDIQNASNP